MSLRTSSGPVMIPVVGTAIAVAAPTVGSVLCLTCPTERTDEHGV